MPSTECKAKRNPAMPSSVPSNSTCLIIAVIIESVLAHTCWSTQTAGGCMRTEMMSLSSMHYIAIMKQYSLNSLCMQYRRVPPNHYVCVKIHRMAATSPKVTTCQSRWMWERRAFTQTRCDQTRDSTIVQIQNSTMLLHEALWKHRTTV